MNTLDVLAAATAKASLLIVSAGIVAVILNRRSAALRHAVWSAAMAGVLLVGPLSLLVPSWRVAPRAVVSAYRSWAPAAATRSAAPAVARPPADPRTSSRQPVSRREEPGFHLRFLVYGWAGGALALSIWLGAAAMRTARHARQAAVVTDAAIAELAEATARQLGVDPERVRLRWTRDEATPIAWGILHPVVLLPEVCRDWDKQRLHQVLLHEIGHIQRWDVLTQAMSSAATALYWFNPLVWLAAQRMLVERERACDDLVLSHGAKPSEYAHELLEIARGMGNRWAASQVSPAMARRSQLSGRLVDVLDPHRRREGAGRTTAVAAALACAAVILPLAALSPPAAARTDDQTVAVAAMNPQSPDAQELAAVNAAFIEAVRRRDSQAIADLYTFDSMIVTPGGPPVRGRQAVREAYDAAIAEGMADAEIRTQEFYNVGDLICDVGRGTVLSDKGEVISNVRSMTLWKKEAGKWRIHRDYTVQD